MTVDIRHTAKGDIALVSSLDGKISDSSFFLDILMNARAETVVLEKSDFDERVFDLSTRIFGDMLQKVSNYRKRLILLGDFTMVESKSFRDFIYECNITGHVVFERDLESGLEKIKL